MELLDQAVDIDKTKSINFKKVLTRYLKQWPWFLLSMILFYMASRIYLRYAEPQYLTKTSLKLQESRNKGTALSDMKNLGMGVSSDSELQGETTVVTSKPILTQVAKNLNLDITYFSVGKIKEVELYNDSPLTGKIIALNSPTFSGSSYTIAPKGKRSYKLIDAGGHETGYPFGVPAKLPFGEVLLDVKPGSRFVSPIKIVFRNLNAVVSGLEGRIGVALPPNKGMLMELSLVGPVPAKSEDILNEVARQYNIDGVKDKNLESQNTQDFIDERLAIISDDLSGIEVQKEHFKRQNQITDLESQAGMALSDANESTKALLNYSTQLDLINSVYAAAGTGKDQLLPSNMGLSSGVESNIAKYNEMVLTRNRVLKQATYENPSIIEMNRDIAELKNLIRKNLAESRETLQLQMAQQQAQLNVSKERISRYPTQEKVFRDIERQRTLKEQLYLYLLQKREENAITLAVTAPKAKVVNPAATFGQVEPNRQRITLGALTLGFLTPLLLFFVVFSLDTKVHRRDDILYYIPEAVIAAEIPVVEAENAIVHPKDFSVFAESFRILSSNLKFLLKTKETDEKNKGVILVTSSIKGEGKTTVAMNLALTLASKNRVLLIGADIRNPQLHRFVDGKNFGLTDYLIGDDNTPENYLRKSGIAENLEVMFSGAIAPNPNDLLDMQKFDDMIEHLKTVYDYIILDTAPVMLVSDTRHLVDNADALLYVVKSGFSEKEMMEFAIEFSKTNDVKRMAYVLNGVTPQNTKYGKKYGYGYYSYGPSEPKKPPFWKRLF